MAEIIYHKKHQDFYEFRLSNKPEYLFLCDLEDFKYLFDGGWYVHVAKSKNAKPYIRRTIYPSQKQFHFHRIIMSAGEFTQESIVDHIDRNTLDNRKSNLRIVDFLVNIRNCDRRMTRKYKDFYYSIAQFQRNGVTRYQAYYKQTYIVSSNDIDAVVSRVEQFFNQRIKDEQTEKQGNGN